MRVLCVLGLLAVGAGPAFAQPPSLTVSAPVLDATGATFTITWPGGGSFPWSGGYSDGSAFQQGASASPLTLRMPYNAAGAAAAWVCASTSCASSTVPAKPVTPPASTTLLFGYREPTTNADGTPLTDLAGIRLYWKLNNGLENGPFPFPASSLTGGAFMTQSMAVPAATGTLTAEFTAVDTLGNESARSVRATTALGVVSVPGTPTTKPGVTIRYQ